ncbi:esterase/lipase family protein [Paludisphaera rhizosphaerae]|uniref:esterase/lipase family protein n=1 Tax=Paludisphaera rhizosphaerae TaxID=2711216 RepID=UPI0013ED8DDD|nr:alpha/beta hydrolase [Paludisphaera rhizosphaerae]
MSPVHRLAIWGLIVALSVSAGPAKAREDESTPSPTSVNRLRIEPMGLSIPSPYQPGKIPVVLIPGLWFNPTCWTPLIRALEADPQFTSAYQIWTFGYASNDPLAYSTMILRRAIAETRHRVDPDRRDPALDRMILIGHSMGGLVAKLAAVDGGDRFWRLVSDEEPSKLTGDPADLSLARETLMFRAIPEVKTVVFLATPHRGGTPNQWLLHDVATRFVPRPDALLKAHDRLVAANPPNFFKPTFRGSLTTSIDDMRWNSPIIREMVELRPPATVSWHSIIPVKNGPAGPSGNDGVVAYSSAHVEGAASETIIPAGHFCLDSPQMIAEVRRILLQENRR